MCLVCNRELIVFFSGCIIIVILFFFYYVQYYFYYYDHSFSILVQFEKERKSTPAQIVVFFLYILESLFF